MKIFWSWQSDRPKEIGHYFVRDVLRDAVKNLKQSEEIEEATREAIHVDHDIKDVSGSPDLMGTILKKIEKTEVFVADVTIVGSTPAGKSLINSNVAIELGYALRECTDSRVVLVFNEHYGKYDALPFDLRHKGGAVVFDLRPEASPAEIAGMRHSLTDAFVRKLRPFLDGPARIKEALSLKPIITHRILQRHRMPSGGTDDVFEIDVCLENDGEMAVAEFLLALEMPSNFPDNGIPYGMKVEPTPEGFVRWSRTHSSSGIRVDMLHPETKTQSLIKFNGGVRDQTKRMHPEELEKKITASVYSGNMRKKVTHLTIKDLYDGLR